MPDQALRPVFEGGRLGGKIHRLLATELCAGGLQVFQQNSPGHAIDGQMVNDDEQAGRALRAEIKESSLEQRAVGKIQAGLQLTACPIYTGNINDTNNNCNLFMCYFSFFVKAVKKNFDYKKEATGKLHTSHSTATTGTRLYNYLYRF